MVAPERAVEVVVSKQTIPDSEWTVTVSFYKGDRVKTALVQRTIAIADTQRHNLGTLVQGLVNESFELLPNKLKRRRTEKGGKQHA